MKHAKLTIGAFFIAGFALACDSGGGEYVKQMESFAEKTCACKDAECTTKVQKEYGEWATKNAETAAGMDSSDAEKITAATSKMTKCVTDIATKGAGQ